MSSEDLSVTKSEEKQVNNDQPSQQLDESIKGDEKSQATVLTDEYFSKQRNVKIDEEDVELFSAADEEGASETKRRSTLKSVTIDDFLTARALADESHRFSLTEEDGANIEEAWEAQKTAAADVNKQEQLLIEESAEESEESEKISDDTVVIDRNMYYELHQIFTERYRKEKMKNNFLQATLASYYTRRKMLYVLREQNLYHLDEIQKKYEKELDALEHLMEESERDKEMSEGEVRHLRHKRDTKMSELDELFEKLQREVLEYGKGLTFEKTGRHNMDKITERFTKRQKIQTALTIKLRSQYIKLVNKMNEKVKALEALDHLGPGFRIMDYVQLKSDNRDLHDKLEEKEDELTRLRYICQNTMQVLAHNREKSAVIDLDIDRFKEELEEVDMEYEDARQNLHYIKHERDDFRKDTKNLKLQYSLFINRKLLRDMEQSLGGLDELRNQLEQVKAEYYEKEEQLKMVRKNIEYFVYHKNKEKETALQNDDDSSDDI